MSKVYLKPYAPYSITGRDFAPMTNDSIRRMVFSPDNMHSISLMQMHDGCLCFTNGSRSDFSFSVSRAHKVLMVVKVRAKENSLLINTNWLLTQTCVQNREIHTNPDLLPVSKFNIDFTMEGIGRVDLKVEESGYVACLLSVKDLMSVRFNGNHSIPRLEYFIESEVYRRLEPRVRNETARRLENPATKTRIGKEFFQDWVKKHQWGLN